ncbi:MAG: YqzL family protein [Oscillospiraceae bacterium]|nr:YqzL family protein [Oscillospiraceae bacterium]
MIKQIAWNTFKNTGNINAFLELKSIEEIEENLEEKKHENYKNEWGSNSRKIYSRF